MGMKIGSSDIASVHIGTSDISSIYIGQSEVWMSAPLKRVGGRIFYIGNNNGATYKFYDQNMNVLTTQTFEGLENAYYYRVIGTPTIDKFYAAANQFMLRETWGEDGLFHNAAGTAIGDGKRNSEILLGVFGSGTGTIWNYLKSARDTNYFGCDDWYIPSVAEARAFRNTGINPSVFQNYFWTSSEIGAAYPEIALTLYNPYPDANIGLPKSNYALTTYIRSF